MNYIIRPYQAGDRKAIIDIFHSNCPKYFDRKDLDDLLYFLDHFADENFKVVLLEDQPIGCGGHYIKQENKVFGIAWVMFKRRALGAGCFLRISPIFFQNILSAIENEPYAYDIVINTTQLLARFFYTYGFETERVIKNGFGIMLDQVVMRRIYAKNIK